MQKKLKKLSNLCKENLQLNKDIKNQSINLRKKKGKFFKSETIQLTMKEVITMVMMEKMLLVILKIHEITRKDIKKKVQTKEEIDLSNPRIHDMN